MARKIGYRWHLRRLMAEKDMYATTQLRPLLSSAGSGYAMSGTARRCGAARRAAGRWLP